MTTSIRRSSGGRSARRRGGWRFLVVHRSLLERVGRPMCRICACKRPLARDVRYSRSGAERGAERRMSTPSSTRVEEGERSRVVDIGGRTARNVRSPMSWVLPSRTKKARSGGIGSDPTLMRPKVTRLVTTVAFGASVSRRPTHPSLQQCDQNSGRPRRPYGTRLVATPHSQPGG
jgi:hypothetical protein